MAVIKKVSHKFRKSRLLSKLRAKQPKRIFILLFVLLFVLVISLVVFQYKNTYANCEGKIQKIEQLVKSKNYRDASVLIKDNKSCGDINPYNSKDGYVSVAQYYRYDALILQREGNEKEASRAAKQSLDAYVKIPDDKKSAAIEDSFQLVIDMSDIEKGRKVNLDD